MKPLRPENVVDESLLPITDNYPQHTINTNTGTSRPLAIVKNHGPPFINHSLVIHQPFSTNECALLLGHFDDSIFDVGGRPRSAGRP